MSFALHGSVTLVTGASRGIGAATAIRLAQMGSDIVVNFRSKSARAYEVAQEIVRVGRRALPAQADLTVESELTEMMTQIQQTFGKLDVVVLNASGGLEKGKAADYAMTLNCTAQLQTARQAAELMPEGGRIVFVTSHWAHFYGQQPVMAGYESVALSKHAGEQALRAYVASLEKSGISLVVVSGYIIEGTITPRLLERQNPGMMEQRREQVKDLPTIETFAEAIAYAAADRTLPSGHTIFVGAVS